MGRRQRPIRRSVLLLLLLALALLLGLLSTAAALAPVTTAAEEGEEEEARAAGMDDDAFALGHPGSSRYLRRRRGRHGANGNNVPRPQAPAKFDFYVLATFWPAELCHRETTNACQVPEPWWKVNMTGHGLWPNNADGTYPSNCGGEKYNTSIVEKDITLPVMMTVWPNYQYDISDGINRYDNLWEHEWVKHGTCSGLSQQAYFNTALRGFMVATPPAFASAASASRTMQLSDAQNFFGGPDYAVLQCGGGKYFEGLYTCWSRDPATQMPRDRIPCPPAVRNETSCRSSVLMIPHFG